MCVYIILMHIYYVYSDILYNTERERELWVVGREKRMSTIIHHHTAVVWVQTNLTISILNEISQFTP